MKREHIEQMISQIDENFIKETIDACRQEDAGNRKRGMKIERWAVAAACAIVLGTGITATASEVFRGWLTGIFGEREITKVDLGLEDEPADLPADKNSHLSLGEDMEIYGRTESFVCQYHMKEADAMIVDKLYSIQNDGLKKMEMKRFQGDYDGVEFSFEYAVINKEIYGCNLEGAIYNVFHYMDGGTAYVDLGVTKDDIFVKGCIARVDLNTGEVEKLTDDKTIGNMIMSPNGKVILINYRSDGYWAAFDIASRKERKIKEIDGYARTNHIVFQDDYHVLTYGISEEGEEGMPGTKVIDLRTGQRTASYKGCGEYNPAWLYEQEGDKLTIQHIDGTSYIEIEGVKGYPVPVSSWGDYVLLKDAADEKAPYYLCNLKKKAYMTIAPPSGLKENVEIYLAAKEEKILLTDGKDAYLVDIRDIG